jgi:hypothetical protein
MMRYINMIGKMKIQWLPVLFLATILFSCADRKENFLVEYADVRCQYQQVDDSLSAAIQAGTADLQKRKIEIEKKFAELSNPYHEKIQLLNDEIKQVQQEYMTAYRKSRITDSASFREKKIVL